VPGDTTNRYWVPVDAEAENDVHAHALALVGRGKRVLELGCAAGHVTRALVDRRCEVVGIEADAEAASNLDDLADHEVDVFVGDLTDPTIVQKAAEGRTFDVVLAGDVLEHLPDPVSTLLACRDVLRPDGYLVVSLPNIAHADVALRLLDGQFGYRDTGLLDRTHLRFFTLEGVHQLLEDAGFVGIEVRRVIRPIFETELAPDPADFGPAVVERALAAPEAETYQFVVRAVPQSGHTEVAALADRAIRAEDELRRGELDRLVLEAELCVVRDALLDCQRQLHELGERSGREGHELREQIERCETLIGALFSTKTLRAAAPFRAAYAASRRGDPRGG
jgi:SAM-dependent methyltransferase